MLRRVEGLFVRLRPFAHCHLQKLRVNNALSSAALRVASSETFRLSGRVSFIISCFPLFPVCLPLLATEPLPHSLLPLHCSALSTVLIIQPAQPNPSLSSLPCTFCLVVECNL